MAALWPYINDTMKNPLFTVPGGDEKGKKKSRMKSAYPMSAVK